MPLFAFAVACSASPSEDTSEVDSAEGALEQSSRVVCTPVELSEARVDHDGDVFDVEKITFTPKRDDTVQLKVERKTESGRAMDAIIETTPSFVQTDRTLRASAKRDVMLKAGKSSGSDTRYVGFVTVHRHTFAVECEVTGQSRPSRCRAGSSRQDVDGCNTCTCQRDGSWACTEMFCAPPARPPGRGSVCRDGEERPAGDGCNTCGCTNGQWGGCTELACGARPARNQNGGGTCQEGHTMSLDGCNTCTCNGGYYACTELFCAPR